MFAPRYTITDALLSRITRIHALVREINDRRFPNVVLVTYEAIAREVSTHASTSIEGNPLPLTEVKRILKSHPKVVRDSEKEVLNYNHALTRLNEELRKKNDAVSLPRILSLHKDVMNGLLPRFELGKLRKQPVVVNDPRTGRVVYLPPDADRVKSLMTDLVDFVRRNAERIDPLILAGVFHKQMVIIHPFTDGNGRTTRLATKALLARMGLDTFHLFSFENYYNNNVTKYFRFVGEYGDYNELVTVIDFTPWLEYFTDGIIDELLRVNALLPTVGTTPSTKLEAHHQKILDYCATAGFITDREYATLTDRAKATRALDFQKLVRLGLLERKGKGRSTYYILKS